MEKRTTGSAPHRNKQRRLSRRRVSALAVLLSGVLLLAGCGFDAEGIGGLAQAVRDFFDPSKTSEEVGEEAAQAVSTLTGGGSGADSGSAESGSQDTAAGSGSEETEAPEKPWVNFSINPLEWTGEYQDKLPTNETLFRNNAVSYYYYGQLSQEEQAIYDALLTVAKDPTSTEYHKKVYVTVDPDSDEFSTEAARAYEAMIFDHPELFWFRQNSGNFRYYYSFSDRQRDSYAVMVALSRTYDNYEAEMTAFNQAVDNFLAGIDLTASQPSIELQIHDHLIDLVTYDQDLAAAYTPDGEYDYGYSAYGALVANSRGQANTCVCDGYSYAFEYLCQMAGLTVTRVGGYAGGAGEQLVGHSWNLVNLDGQWYEVDPTWDDRDLQVNPDEAGAQIYSEAVSDTAFWGRIRHYMYNLTTDEITNYTPGPEYTYYAQDGSGSYATFLSASVHQRDDGSDPASTGDYLSCLAPVADGTTYTYAYMMGQ